MADSKTRQRTFEVLVSFDGLDKGDRFPAVPDAWSDQHVKTGYLGDVTGEPTAAEVQGGVAPQAPESRVEGARNAGEVGKG